MNAALKILAVDNEQLLLFALNRAFKGRSIDIRTAITSEQALDEIANNHFDLFLVDFDLLDQRSLELLREIDESCPYVPIIVMTRSAMSSVELNDVIRTIRKKGSWHLLEKPFSLDKMLGIVSVIFEDQDKVKLCVDELTHNYDHEKRHQFRRPHVQPIEFFLNTIDDGVTSRTPVNGILTDLSDYGTGMLANELMQPEQLVSFKDDFKEKYGVVAWSLMIEPDTCRFGVEFC